MVMFPLKAAALNTLRDELGARDAGHWLIILFIHLFCLRTSACDPYPNIEQRPRVTLRRCMMDQTGCSTCLLVVRHSYGCCRQCAVAI